MFSFPPFFFFPTSSSSFPFFSQPHLCGGRFTRCAMVPLLPSPFFSPNSGLCRRFSPPGAQWRKERERPPPPLFSPHPTPLPFFFPLFSLPSREQYDAVMRRSARRVSVASSLFPFPSLPPSRLVISFFFSSFSPLSSGTDIPDSKKERKRAPWPFSPFSSCIPSPPFFPYFLSAEEEGGDASITAPGLPLPSFSPLFSLHGLPCFPPLPFSSPSFFPSPSPRPWPGSDNSREGEQTTTAAVSSPLPSFLSSSSADFPPSPPSLLPPRH